MSEQVPNVGPIVHYVSHGTSPRSPQTAFPRLDVGNATGDQWCGVCKAYTGFTVDLVAIGAEGVTVVGTVTGCIICDDPDDPEARRG
jgi:hypothetical protein